MFWAYFTGALCLLGGGGNCRTAENLLGGSSFRFDDLFLSDRSAYSARFE